MNVFQVLTISVMLAMSFMLLKWLCRVSYDKSIATMLSNKYKLPLPILLSTNKNWISHPSLEKDLELVMTSQCGGVYVLWLPVGSGKSSTMFHISKILQERQQIGGVLISQLTTVNVTQNLEMIVFNENFGYNKFLSSFLSSEFQKKPLIVFLDNVDKWKLHPGLENFMIALATDSTRSCKYITIVSVSDPKLAQKILDWNSNQKIFCIGKYNHLRYKWNSNQIQQQMISLSISIANSQITQLANLAGSPSFLLIVKNNYGLSKYQNFFHASSDYFNATWNSGPKQICKENPVNA